jgi:hypothetical protein
MPRSSKLRQLLAQPCADTHPPPMHHLLERKKSRALLARHRDQPPGLASSRRTPSPVANDRRACDVSAAPPNRMDALDLRRMLFFDTANTTGLAAPGPARAPS